MLPAPYLYRTIFLETVLCKQCKFAFKCVNRQVMSGAFKHSHSDAMGICLNGY